MYRHTLLHAALAALLCTSIALPAVAAPAATANAKPAVRAAAQAQARYRVVDLGSFGGGFGLFQGRLNMLGMAAGIMTTPASDPFYPNCFFTCNVDHAFLYAGGQAHDLGALAEGVSSAAFGVNQFGLVFGQAQNGQVDAATGFPEAHPVAWINRRIVDLGTLGGTQGAAVSMNAIGQAVGASLNAKPDPYAAAPMQACLWLPNNGVFAGYYEFAMNSFFAPASTETHATYWWGSAKIDMGTLGGPDSNAYAINQLGQAVGWSYTSGQANEFGHPDVHPFVWSARDRKMRDLGSLGGSCGMATAINNRGQVVGGANLPGDMTMHAFIWTARDGMRDIGTLAGGTYSHAGVINDAGEVAGFSTGARDAQGKLTRRAFYWKNGVMRDLGTIDGLPSDANGINSRGQVVGETFDIDHGNEAVRGWVADRGGTAIDLNTLIPADSGYFILSAMDINDLGEIAARAITADGEERPVKLVPIR